MLLLSASLPLRRSLTKLRSPISGPHCGKASLELGTSQIRAGKSRHIAAFVSLRRARVSAPSPFPSAVKSCLPRLSLNDLVHGRIALQAPCHSRPRPISLERSQFRLGNQVVLSEKLLQRATRVQGSVQTKDRQCSWSLAAGLFSVRHTPSYLRRSERLCAVTGYLNLHVHRLAFQLRWFVHCRTGAIGFEAKDSRLDAASLFVAVDKARVRSISLSLSKTGHEKSKSCEFSGRALSSWKLSGEVLAGSS